MKLPAHIDGAPCAVMERELIRLRSELTEVLAIPLSTKPHAPSSVPTRVRHAAPTEAAVALDIGHISRQVSESFGEILAFTNAGVFRAPRSNRSTKTAAPPGDLALVGAHFRKSGANWKVLDLRWCPATSSMVMWYFDQAMASVGGVSEGIMKEHS